MLGDFIENLLEVPDHFWKHADILMIEMVVRDSESRPVLHERALKILAARRIYDICEVAKRLRVTARKNNQWTRTDLSIASACIHLGLDPEQYFYQAFQYAKWGKAARHLDQVIARSRGEQSEMSPARRVPSLFPEAKLPRIKGSCRRNT